MVPNIDLRKKIFIESDDLSNKLNEPNLLTIDYFDIMKCKNYDELKEILFFNELEKHIDNNYIQKIIICHLLYINILENNDFTCFKQYFELKNIELLDKIRIKLRKIFI